MIEMKFKCDTESLEKNKIKVIYWRFSRYLNKKQKTEILKRYEVPNRTAYLEAWTEPRIWNRKRNINTGWTITEEQLSIRQECLRSLANCIPDITIFMEEWIRRVGNPIALINKIMTDFHIKNITLEFTRPTGISAETEDEHEDLQDYFEET